MGSVVMRAAGCVVNDLWDRDIDRKVARTAGRPLASGALRPCAGAGVPGRRCCWWGWSILLQLNLLAQALGAASLVLVALYPLAKRVTWWPQLMMGFTFGFGAPLGYAAAAGRISMAPGSRCMPRRSSGTSGSIRSTRTRIARTTRWWACSPRRGCSGSRRGRSWQRATRRLWCARCWPAGSSGGLGWWFYPALLPAGAACWRGRLWRLDIHDPALCLRLFRANREVGLAVGLALLIGRF